MKKDPATTQEEAPRVHRHVDEYSEVLRAEVPSDSCFGAYVPKPTKTRIDIQAHNEHILLLLRQHWVTQVGWILTLMFMLALPFLFVFSGIFNFLNPGYQFAGFIAWNMICIGFAIESILKWFYGVYIVTDERIIDVDFISMLYKDVSTTKIDKIEDVTSVSSGFLSSIFDYGTVTIQTAATKQELAFEHVPHPARVTALLNELILEEERERVEGRVS